MDSNKNHLSLLNIILLFLLLITTGQSRSLLSAVQADNLVSDGSVLVDPENASPHLLSSTSNEEAEEWCEQPYRFMPYMQY